MFGSKREFPTHMSAKVHSNISSKLLKSNSSDMITLKSSSPILYRDPLLSQKWSGVSGKQLKLLCPRLNLTRFTKQITLNRTSKKTLKERLLKIIVYKSTGVYGVEKCLVHTIFKKNIIFKNPFLDTNLMINKFEVI